jgi:acetyl esterase/lipase
MTPPPLPATQFTKPRTSALAVWSLVLAICGFVLLVPALAGIVCGLLALMKIKKSQGALQGRGLAVAGILVSCLPLFVTGFSIYWWMSPRLGDSNKTLAQAREGFSTKLARRESDGGPVAEPPPELKRVSYRSPAGEMAAYLSVVPENGKKSPAIVWLTGGFSNSIDENAWAPAEEENDQSARFFREAGIVTLYPSLRGGNQNPGHNETFFGEVDDVLAATEFLAAQPGIDPDRIYLGGHSTGGTLALLVAESSQRYRAVFAFGPIARVNVYGDENLTYSTNRPREEDLRNPVRWLHAIRTPTYVIEGEDGNISQLRVLKRASKNGLIRFHEIAGKDHFDVLAPYSRIIAKQIATDTGASEFRF